MSIQGVVGKRATGNGKKLELVRVGQGQQETAECPSDLCDDDDLGFRLARDID